MQDSTLGKQRLERAPSQPQLRLDRRRIEQPQELREIFIGLLHRFSPAA
jgi:hypothetical protein